MVNRRGRTSHRSAKRNQTRTFGLALTRATHGVQITPPVDPPSFVSNPWWPITTVIKVTKDTHMKAKDIYDSIIAQLGFETYQKDKNTIPLEFRLISVRAWGTGKQPIQLAIFDPLGQKNRFAELSDFGSAVNYSRVGWKYGRIGTLDAITSGEVDILFDLTGATTNAAIMVYVQLLIRTANAPKPIFLYSTAEPFEVL